VLFWVRFGAVAVLLGHQQVGDAQDGDGQGGLL
jgi:hypothetical protein